MNNNLIPEKRLDKNGRLVTKHVRAGKPLSVALNAPAPSLPTTKKLTPAQRAQKTREVAYAARGDYELKRKLNVDPDGERIVITASDAEFYSVLSVASRANAFMLLESGIRTADDASNYLMDNGFEELIQDNTALCEEALARKIPPTKYIESSVNMRGPESSDFFFDALEVYSSSIPAGGRSHSRLVVASSVYDGIISLNDLKKIGFPAINKFRDKDALYDSLEKVQKKEVNYTAEDLAKLMEKYSMGFRNALIVTELYGAEFALTLHSPDSQYAENLSERGVEKERAMKLLTFSDQLAVTEQENEVYRPQLPYSMIEKCFDLGLSLTQVATQDYTEQQLDGLLAGVTSSVSSGWL